MDGYGRSRKKSTDAAADAAAQAEFNEKKWVWVPDEHSGYLPGWIVKEEIAEPARIPGLNKALAGREGDYAEGRRGHGGHGKEVSIEEASRGGDTVADVMLMNGTEVRSLPSYTLSKMNPPKFDRVDDIADLTFLNEASVVHNLRLRYGAGSIYTYSGLFLISINPYKDLNLYTPEIIASYRKRRRDESSPHIFATAERAWVQVGEERECQSILITGESGAGKTENTKKVIQYLAAIAPSTSHHKQPSSTLSPSSSSSSIAPRIGLPHSHSFQGRAELELAKNKKTGTLEDQILQANPILEAFGNAQTLRNNNSSRFGKFIRILFSSSGAITGANVDWYLLEKSRVTARAKGERNFHVFYQLLASGVKGKSLREKLLLTGQPEDYGYLKESRTTIDGVDDLSEWDQLKTALATVGFASDEQFEIFRVIAAILHISNIETKSDRSDQAYILSPREVEKACHLLGISATEFSRAVLTPKVKAGREVVTQARSKVQADNELGALCKLMYERTFGALVERINKALDRPAANSLFIGVLDIAGFEIFDVNGYEQLLINYTNERLQQYFNHHMFILEQEEYGRENIEWKFVNFGLDLQPTIELIESTQPIGILSTLDEECIMPKATDLTFLDKIKAEWDPASKSSNIGSSKFASTRFGKGFIIKHYAGPVEYSTEGWLAKNKDPINDDVAGLLSNSTHPSIAAMFAEYGEKAQSSGLINGKRVKRGAFRTAAQKHREQLTSLVSQLQATQPHFVRCIVPNATKKPAQMEVKLVLDQLRCNGVLEGIRIARLGYPNRLPFVEFRQRYEVLCPDIIPKGFIDGRKACLKMAEALDIPPDVHKMGLTKIFFKAGVLAELEERRDAHLFDVFARFQAAARRSMASKKLKKLLNRAMAVRTIQRNARTYIELRDWPWWQLFNQVKPLLAATREDDVMGRKRLELALAKERHDRDEAEKARLAELQSKAEADMKRFEASLDAERRAMEEKEKLLVRSKETETGLQDEVRALQGDVDQLEEQLAAANSARAAAEAAAESLQRDLTTKSKDSEDLSQRESLLQRRLAEATERLLGSSQKMAASEKDKAALDDKLQDALRQCDRAREDLHTAKDRVKVAEKAAQDRLNAEKSKSADALNRLEAVMREAKEKEGRLSALTAAAGDVDVLLKKKEATIATLNSDIDGIRRDLASLKRQLQEVQAGKEKAERDLADGLKDVERLNGSNSRLQQELDGLRRLMTAKRDEDAQRKEAEDSRENELKLIRSQLKLGTQQTKRVQEEFDRVKLDLERKLSETQNVLDRTNVQFRSLTTAHKEAQEKVANQADLVSTAQTASRALESDLSETRKKLLSKAADLEEAIKAREGLERSHSIAQAKISDYEDAVLVVERERVDWARRLDNANKDLQAERNRNEATESELRNILADNKAMRQQADHAKSVAKLQEDEIALLRSRENKTIVEHVHVLEKAKRVTDRELAAMIQERDQMTSVLRSLEQQKNRLTGDLEDSARQNELLKSELRESRKVSGSPSAVQAGGQAALLAEKDARRRSDVRVAELEKSLPQLQELPKVKQQLVQTQDANSRLQKEIVSLRQELQKAEQNASKADNKGSGGSASSYRLLQELHLNNEELQREMADELRRNVPTSTGDVDVRIRRENYRKSMDASLLRGGSGGGPDDATKVHIAQQRIGRDLQHLRSELATAQNAAKTAQKAQHDADQRRAAAENKFKSMTDGIDDATLNNSAAFAARLSKEIEKERARAQKDLQDFERTVFQTRAKYQSELSRLTEDLANQRDDMLRYKEANRLLKAKEEELRRELEDELHSSSGWKREKERLESRIVDLNQALEDASSSTDDSKSQQVKFVTQINDLRRRLDETETECSVLRQAKQRLEERSSALFDKELKATRLDQNRAVQQLSAEKQDLQASLDSATDKINLVKQKQARSEAYAAECLQELGKVRKVNTDVDRRNTALEKEIKGLHVRIVDLETQSYANSPRPAAAKRLESKVNEMQAKLDSEITEKNEILKRSKLIERQARDLQGQLQDLSSKYERQVQEGKAYEKAIEELQQSLRRASSGR